MNLRKLLGVCVAVLLIAGFSSQASALDVADPQGIWIRVTSPADSTWLKIADTLRVEVLCLQDVVDTVFCAVVTDTSATVGEAYTVRALGGGTPRGGKRTTTSGVKIILSDSLQTKTNASSPAGVDTFRFKFGIAPGDVQTSGQASLSVLAFVKRTAGSSWEKLSNRTITQQVVPGTSGFATVVVGDGKRHGQDGQRPVVGTVIDSVRIDTTGTVALVGGRRGLKLGTNAIFKLRLNVGQVLSAGATSAKVILIADTANVSSATAIDSSMITAITFTNLFTADQRDTVAIAAGTYLKDQRKVTAAAFLEDAAGNLGGATASAAAPSGVTSGVFYVADALAPTITPMIPKVGTTADSARFTGAQTLTYDYRYDTNGSLAAVAFAAKPLKFKLSEKVATAKAYIGTDSMIITGEANVAGLIGTAGYAFTTSDSTAGAGATNTAYRQAQAGTSLALNLVAIDSVGNMSNLSQTVTFDMKAPSFDRIFPTKATAPTNSANSNKPTINAATKDPVVRLKEALDTLSVRYVQTGTSSPLKTLAGFGPAYAPLATVGTDISLAFGDTLRDATEYTLQLYSKDKSGNVYLSAPDTLTYTKNFLNPVADSIVVAFALNDSVLAGQPMQLNLTALDTSLTNAGNANVTAVTYKGSTKLYLRTAAAEASKLAGVTFWGTGVSVAAADSGLGIATLNTDTWVTGTRTIYFKSTTAIDSLWAEIIDVTSNFNGKSAKLSIDAAEMAKYTVTAMEGGVATAGVSQDFQVQVVAADKYGNPSTKTWQPYGASALASATGTDSLALLDSRIETPASRRMYGLSEIFIEFSSNAADAQVPSGPQSFDGDAIFSAVGPDRAGSGLVIGVRTYNAQADTTGFSASNQKHLTASGVSAALSFTAWGEAPPVVVTELDAPDTLIVQDYMGADGLGDQGGFVMVSFPKSAAHATLSQYRLWREVKVTTDIVSGKLTVLTTPVNKWVSWTAIDAVPGTDTVMRAVVPTLDNAATRWAVAAERGGVSSEQVAAGKRIFTKESVQQMVQLLGIDPNRVLTNDELLKQFTAPKDYVQSILGDQKNLVFAALDPDVTTLVGTTTLPENIRTAGGEIISSARTEAAATVAAKDNIAPAAVTNAKATPTTGQVALTWTASADDKTVGYMTYRGYSVPIAGVAQYQIYRGTSSETMSLLTTLPPGAASYTDTQLPQGAAQLAYRVDALDLDNVTAGTALQVNLGVGRQKFVDAQGRPVYLVNLTDATPMTCDFPDFIAFAQSYQLSTGQDRFNVQADTNDDGIVNFTDFIAFAQSYQRVAVGPAAKMTSRPALPGVNDNAELSLSLGSDRVLAGQTVAVNVSLSNVVSLYGFDFVVSYDPQKFELIDAVPSQNDLLKSNGGETPLFLKHTDTVGEIRISNAVVNGSSVTGEGDVVTLTFKVLREFEDNARFEIAQGLVVDPDQLLNPVVTLGNLSVETTPTEFALLQNFPNPFNPETSVKYNLAEGANVSLRIYNIVGQVVRTLVAERQAAGRYQVKWNGTDDRGAAVSSGIYFYELSAGKFHDAKRLMLLK